MGGVGCTCLLTTDMEFSVALAPIHTDAPKFSNGYPSQPKS